MGLQICEIFYSLQGESSFAGLPCIFIRLSGCNLNCAWCDTGYAQEEFTQLSIDQVLERIRPYDCRLVEITGGEPLIQEETPILAQRLMDLGYTVLVETNGSLDISRLSTSCIRIVDVKCPSSNEAKSFLIKNIDHLTANDEIKFVVGTRDDYEHARQIITTRLSGARPEKIHISPVFGQVSPETLAAWILEDRLNARLSLQQHKLIWDPEKRGV